MKKVLLINFIMNGMLYAIGAWMWNNRTHGELNWTTIETENFNIHYHQGLRDIAIQGASLAEQIRPTLMKQVGLEAMPKLDIIFTSEDEIRNAFALMNTRHTVVWVDQNDAVLWTGDEKWLRMVLAHELQHLVFYQVTKGPWWIPEPFNRGLQGTPGWVVEGLAEYYTEKWSPFRYDIAHKIPIMKGNVQKIKDPHNDGFSKSLYLADRFGDTTITKILKYRNNAKYLDFKEAFKKHTGISVKQFNEDWRRQMNTFYFSQRSQKERLEDVGMVKKLPLKMVEAFDYFPDTNSVAMIGRLTRGQYDQSIVIATRDTIQERKVRKKRLKQSKKTGKKPKKVRAKWKIKELDNGRFGNSFFPNLDVSPDGKMIVYPKYGYGNNQSLGFDICLVHVKSKKKVMLTNSMRADYPKFSPDGSTIAFVAHSKNNTQLYLMNSDGSNIRRLSDFEGATGIITPTWSPDGESLVYSKSGPDAVYDIFILDIATLQEKNLSNSINMDFAPIWHPDGQKISFTSIFDENINLFTYDFNSNEIIQNTNLWNMYLGVDWNKKLNTITTITLNTVDSSRVLEIDPNRLVEPSPVTMNAVFSSWRTKRPDYSINDVNYKKRVSINKEEKYKPFSKLRHISTFLLPDYDESLIYNGAFSDVMGRHLFAAAVITDYDTLNSIFFQYQNSTGFPIDVFWGLNIYQDANFQLQFYNKDKSYLETFNGVSIWAKVPYNFGKSLSANHVFSSSLQLVKREQFFKRNAPMNTIFPEPEEGEEGSINLSYLFVNKRPNARNLISPNQGFGLKISFKNTSSNIWGLFDYRKLETDLYNNQKIGPFSLYTRVRFEAMSGSPPAQETLGIFDIPNYYLIGATTPGREYMSPRGYFGQPRFGDQAYMGTLELRAPVLPISIVEFVKLIKIGSPTFALITDFGNAWIKGYADQEMIITLGYEFRMSLNITNVPLLTFSYGISQEKYMWDDGESPQSYFQMTLINPF
tara:strand:- start:96 stop:3029 length:2934 start_codon:yes stop_codon:yes gene_type:complete